MGDVLKKSHVTEEEEDNGMILALHATKRPKHGCSVIGRETLRQERLDADRQLKRCISCMQWRWKNCPTT
jgi:hypothetical protein